MIFKLNAKKEKKGAKNISTKNYEIFINASKLKLLWY